VPEQVRATRDLLLVGRASKLPLLGEIRPLLPAPFEAGSDLAAEPSAPVQYRRARGESVGYIQLLAAPWSKTRTILAVLGSTDQGLRWAGAALTTPELRSRLSGNLAIVQERKISSSDTRPQPPAEKQQAPQPEAAPAAESQPGRAILWAAAAIAVLLLMIIGSLALRWRRRQERDNELSNSM
jgi:hypothetical protein